MITRYDHPAQPLNPYPAEAVAVRSVRYRSALVLVRLKDAVTLRTGEDADYLTGRPFIIEWSADDPDLPEDKRKWQAITVPEGLITDLTSVPRLLRWIIGRVGPWLEAAIVHDYLYIAWQDVPGKSPTFRDRKFADDIMLAAMRAAKVRGWMARAIHWAVSTFGGQSFARRTEDRYVDLSDPDIQQQLAFRMPRGFDAP